MNVNGSVAIAWIDQAKSMIVVHRSKVLGALAAALVAGAGWGVYRYLDNKAHRAAHQDFMAMLKNFDAAEKPGVDQATWQSLVSSAKEYAHKHRGTKMAGVFLAYEADALANADRLQEAVEVMKQAVAKTPTAALREYYDLKAALMMVDSNDETVRTAGLKKLRAMADNPRHAAHVEALFHAGNYGWVNKDFAQAKNYWQQLVIKYANEKSAADYVEKVKNKLELLSV